MATLSIRQTILILVVAPLMGAIALTGWLAFHHERKTVESLVTQIVEQTGDRVDRELSARLNAARLIGNINRTEIRTGDIDLQDLDRLEKHFLEQIEQFEDVTYIYFANEQKEFRGAERVEDGTFNLGISGVSTNGAFQTYDVNDRGERRALIDTLPNLDLRQRPWYVAAVTAGQPTWGPIYMWNAPYPKIVLSHVTPIFQETGALEGVLGVDIHLQHLSDFLSNLERGETGHIFIVERDGNLVASSTTEEPFARTGESAQRLPAIASNQPLVRETTQCLIDIAGGLSRIQTPQDLTCKVKSGQTFVRVSPFGEELGLDWLIAVAIPEADFLHRARTQVRVTLTLLVLAVISGFWVSRRIYRWTIRPILDLNVAAGELETNNFDPNSIEDLTQRSDEVGEFARVFQEMAMVLDDREQSLSQQVQELRSQTSQSQQENLQVRDIEQERLELLQRKARAIRSQVKDSYQ